MDGLVGPSLGACRRGPRIAHAARLERALRGQLGPHAVACVPGGQAMNFAPPPWSLRQIQYAIAVEEMGGFSRAAERCHVSQPALSAQLALLEGSLGARIFERGARRVLITPAGRVLLDHARSVLRAVEQLGEAATRLGDPLTSSIRVGVIPTLAPYLVPELVGPMHKAFPGLRLIWREERTQELRSLLQMGEIDAALVALETDLGDVESAALGRDAFFLAVPPEHPLASGTGPVQLAQLAGETVLLLEDGHCLRDQTLRFCGSKLGAESNVRATSLSTLAQMVAGGIGTTLLPQLSLATENRHERLVIRPFAEAPFRTVGLVWRSRSPFSSALRKLAEKMRDALPASLERPEGSGHVRRSVRGRRSGRTHSSRD